MAPWWIASNMSIGKPPGLAVVFSMSGGAAEISPALAIHNENAIRRIRVALQG
jgi:hypothetical protein